MFNFVDSMVRKSPETIMKLILSSLYFVDSEARKNQETIMKLILTSESSIFLEWPDNEIYIENCKISVGIQKVGLQIFQLSPCFLLAL